MNELEISNLRAHIACNLLFFNENTIKIEDASMWCLSRKWKDLGRWPIEPYGFAHLYYHKERFIKVLNSHDIMRTGREFRHVQAYGFWDQIYDSEFIIKEFFGEKKEDLIVCQRPFFSWDFYDGKNDHSCTYMKK